MIVLPSRQFNDFFYIKGNRKNELMARPVFRVEVVGVGVMLRGGGGGGGGRGQCMQGGTG